MTENSYLYERARSLKSGNEITLEQSKAAYFYKSTVSFFILIWGFSSVFYWLERSLISDWVYKLVGQASLPGADTALKILFGMGLAANFFIPWIVQNLFFTTKITLNESSFIYQTRGRIQKFSWDQVVEIRSSHLHMDERDGGKEVIEVKGKNGRIVIESQYNISTKELLELLRDCWSLSVRKFSISSSTELTSAPANISEEAEVFDKLISTTQSMQWTKEREGDAILKRLLIFSLLFVAVTCIAAVFAIALYLH